MHPRGEGGGIPCARNPSSHCTRRLLLWCNVRDMHLLDGAVELERDLVVVVKRDRRPEGNADIEAVVGGEQQWSGYRHLARRKHFAIDLQRYVERPSGLWHCIRRLHLDLHLTDRKFLSGADLGALDNEKIVF